MARQEQTEQARGRESEARERRLVAYTAATGGLAAGAAGGAADAQGEVVSYRVAQSFGVNEEVNIDFNSDGQIDFQIDHDRVNLNGTDLDYLQIDKNDVNGAANPLDIPGIGVTFPTGGTVGNNDYGVLSFTNDFGDSGGYAVALKAGDVIGADALGSLIAGTKWDFQEGDNFLNGGTTIRANRLIDEDAGQIDQVLGGDTVTVPFGPQPEFPDVDDWLGLEGATRYLGVRVDLNDAAEPGLNDDPVDPHLNFWYGWIGVRIDNEADATGTVTGWGYESDQGVSIVAGDTGPAAPGDFDSDGDVDGADFIEWQQQFGGALGGADFTAWEAAFGASASTQASAASTQAVPEPSSLWLALSLGVALLLGCFWNRHARRQTIPCPVRKN